MPLDYSGVTCVPLLTLDEAKRQLRITDTDHDEDVTQKMAVAQAGILNYLGTAGDATWTPTSVPEDVKHAILLLLSHYYDHRGEDMSPSTSGVDRAIWEGIQRLLAFHRDPTLM